MKNYTINVDDGFAESVGKHAWKIGSKFQDAFVSLAKTGYEHTYSDLSYSDRKKLVLRINKIDKVLRTCVFLLTVILFLLSAVSVKILLEVL